MNIHRAIRHPLKSLLMGPVVIKDGFICYFFSFEYGAEFRFASY
jgi:hypothetical protein